MIADCVLFLFSFNAQMKDEKLHEVTQVRIIMSWVQPSGMLVVKIVDLLNSSLAFNPLKKIHLNPH